MVAVNPDLIGIRVRLLRFYLCPYLTIPHVITIKGVQTTIPDSALRPEPWAFALSNTIFS